MYFTGVPPFKPLEVSSLLFLNLINSFPLNSFVRHFLFCTSSLLQVSNELLSNRVFLEYVKQGLFRTLRPPLPDQHNYRRRRLAPPLHSIATTLYSPSVTN